MVTPLSPALPIAGLSQCWSLLAPVAKCTKPYPLKPNTSWALEWDHNPGFICDLRQQASLDASGWKEQTLTLSISICVSFPLSVGAFRPARPTTRLHLRGFPHSQMHYLVLKLRDAPKKKNKKKTNLDSFPCSLREGTQVLLKYLSQCIN